MNLATPVFRFATLRSAKESPPPDPKNQQPELEILPQTQFAGDVVTTLQGSGTQSDKMQAINQMLQQRLRGPEFFRTKNDVIQRINNPRLSLQGQEATARAGGDFDDAAKQETYEALYDNILIRTLTKSTNSEVFRALTSQIKALHQQLHADKVSADQIKDLRIILPEGLVFSFTPPKKVKNSPTPIDPAPLVARLIQLNEQKQKLSSSSETNASNVVVGQDQPQPEQHGANMRQVAGTEADIDRQIGEVSLALIQSWRKTQLTLLGNSAVNFDPPTFNLEFTTPDSIVVYSDGCWLKFPFQVADLRVIKQRTVGYLPGEIAHIQNTHPGARQKRATRRLTRVETFDSITTEDQTTKETDTQSTDRSTIEKAASQIQTESTSLNVNASVSATYGPVTASLDAGYSSNESAENANSSAQSHAQEVVNKTMERVTSNVTRQRSIKSIEEFEERVEHVVDNTKSTEPRSYVYRWLVMLVNFILHNYGQRLIFQIDIMYPANQFLAGTVTPQPTIDLPPDPRGMVTIGVFPSQQWFPKWRLILPATYTVLADLYKVQLDSPPPKNKLVTYTLAGSASDGTKSATVTLPDGYSAISASVEISVGGGFNWDQWSSVTVMVGNNWVNTIARDFPVTQSFAGIGLSGETGAIPVSVCGPAGADAGKFSVNVEINCQLSPSSAISQSSPNAFETWQLKCHQALADAYDSMKSDADARATTFDPNAPGLNPDAKQGVIMTELKKAALGKMYRCNPFWLSDDYEVGKEYDPDCCKDSLSAEKIRFLETLFDWENMTYELYPYYYADKRSWKTLSSLSDDDPRFQAFLQASCATVRIPVFRDSMKETAAVNFILNNSVANYETVPASMRALLAELDKGEPTSFPKGVGMPDNPSEMDLGIRPVPTDLVILECGTAGGVKPIGWEINPPEKADSGWTLPQYSPAIIADRCDNPTGPTAGE